MDLLYLVSSGNRTSARRKDGSVTYVTYLSKNYNLLTPLAISEKIKHFLALNPSLTPVLHLGTGSRQPVFINIHVSGYNDGDTKTSAILPELRK